MNRQDPYENFTRGIARRLREFRLYRKRPPAAPVDLLEQLCGGSSLQWFQAQETDWLDGPFDDGPLADDSASGEVSDDEPS